MTFAEKPRVERVPGVEGPFPGVQGLGAWNPYSTPGKSYTSSKLEIDSPAVSQQRQELERLSEFETLARNAGYSPIDDSEGEDE